MQLLLEWYLMQVMEAQVDMPVVGAISLYVSLLTFTLRVHPDRLDYVDQVLVYFFIWAADADTDSCQHLANSVYACNLSIPSPKPHIFWYSWKILCLTNWKKVELVHSHCSQALYLSDIRPLCKIGVHTMNIRTWSIYFHKQKG